MNLYQSRGTAADCRATSAEHPAITQSLIAKKTQSAERACTSTRARQRTAVLLLPSIRPQYNHSSLKKTNPQNELVPVQGTAADCRATSAEHPAITQSLIAKKNNPQNEPVPDPGHGSGLPCYFCRASGPQHNHSSLRKNNPQNERVPVPGTAGDCRATFSHATPLFAVALAARRASGGGPTNIDRGIS